ncbi:MAG: hypothetical protein ACRDNY_12240 [Gaiellaceae bacterium]
MRPLDRCSQRLLAGIGIAPSSEQVEPLGEPLERLRRREHVRPGGGELERERQIVERTAELVDGRVRLRPRPRTEELDRLRIGER